MTEFPAVAINHDGNLHQTRNPHHTQDPGAILVGLFFIVLILRSVRYAYESLGVSSNTAIFLLFATLIGSIFNIPIAELPPVIHAGV
jgi:amino acid transporter